MYPAPREPHSAGFSCACAEAPQKNARPTKDSTNLNFIKPPGIDFLRAQTPPWARCAEKPMITIWDGVEGPSFQTEPVCEQIARARQSSTLRYPAITSSFSDGIFPICSWSRFRCAVTASGGKRLSQLFKETSTNRSALNISKNTTSVLPVFST